MRKRRLRKLWDRLCELKKMKLSAKTLLIKIGEAKKGAGLVFGLLDLKFPNPSKSKRKKSKTKVNFSFRINRASFAMPIDAKVATCCAATCPSKFQPRSGNTTSNSFKWRKPNSLPREHLRTIVWLCSRFNDSPRKPPSVFSPEYIDHLPRQPPMS
jgi:hypothetical protein